MALCPAHHDRNPSLSIGEAPDGTALLYCFAGCTYKEILEALGINLPHDPPEPKAKKNTPDFQDLSRVFAEELRKAEEEMHLALIDLRRAIATHMKEPADWFRHADLVHKMIHLDYLLDELGRGVSS